MLTFFSGLSLTSISAIVVTTNSHDCFDFICNYYKRAHAKDGYRNIRDPGTASLILYGKSIGSATNASLGNILVF
jgi:hypothetical protein